MPRSAAWRQARPAHHESDGGAQGYIHSQIHMRLPIHALTNTHRHLPALRIMKVMEEHKVTLTHAHALTHARTHANTRTHLPALYIMKEMEEHERGGGTQGFRGWDLGFRV